MRNVDWKSALEIIGLTAVVASLILVAFELRQNTDAVRASAVQAATMQSREQLLTLAQDADLARIASASYSELSETDQRRKFFINRSYWIGMQGLYRQHSLGVLPDEEWESWARIMCLNYETRVEELWPGTSQMLATDFIAVLESCASPSK